jgi:hypothetical protein
VTLRVPAAWRSTAAIKRAGRSARVRCELADGWGVLGWLVKCCDEGRERRKPGRRVSGEVVFGLQRVGGKGENWRFSLPLTMNAWHLLWQTGWAATTST